jgi:hypothetical protein
LIHDDGDGGRRPDCLRLAAPQANPSWATPRSALALAVAVGRLRRFMKLTPISRDHHRQCQDFLPRENKPHFIVIVPIFWSP